PPRSTLFPYTALFRSVNDHLRAGGPGRAGAVADCLQQRAGRQAGEHHPAALRLPPLQLANNGPAVSITRGRVMGRQVSLPCESEDRKSTRLNSSHVKI